MSPKSEASAALLWTCGLSCLSYWWIGDIVADGSLLSACIWKVLTKGIKALPLGDFAL